jgi:uncharacterized membrane protein
MTSDTELPPHVEETVMAIAKLHADHHQEAGRLQRLVERLTAWIGRPQFIAILFLLIFVWVAGNLIVGQSGQGAWDVAPFPWLQDALAVLALFVPS